MQRSLAAALGMVGALAFGGAVFAGTTQYRSQPVGEFEVPANDSTAEASFKLKVAPDGQSARFDLKITEPINNVTMAHLHLAGLSGSGPPVVWLYPAAPPMAPLLIPGTTDGRLSSGTITVDNLVDPLAGDWDGFIAALEDGRIYVNVHTSAHPAGEIRDQVHAHPG